jgi:flagellar motility protein MotE (MotC chaperone)
MRWRPRLLPAALAATVLLLVAKLGVLATGQPAGLAELLPPAQASSPAPPPPEAPLAPASAPETPTPEQRAERVLLEGLRARRAELDSRDQALAAREMVLAAAERRLGQRIEELTALQQRLETIDRGRGERGEAGLRQLVKLYEGMRPRDAAAIFDDLDMAVLVQLVDRMREAKAAPVLGAMKPDRARLLTAELARHRSRPAD